MAEIGIGQSTYYKWLDKFERHGDRWLAGERMTKPLKRIGAMTHEDTKAYICQLAIEEPSLGPHRLACKISRDRGESISPSTIYKILDDKGLNSSEKRDKELKRQLSNRDDKKARELRDKHAKYFAKKYGDPGFGWGKEISDEAGRVLAQGVYRPAWQWGIPQSRIHIVVDTSSKHYFASIADIDDHEAARDCLKTALTLLCKNPESVAKVYYDHPNRVFTRKSYTKFLKQRNLPSAPYAVNANGTNPMVYGVIDRLRAVIRKEIAKDPELYREEPTRLNKMILSFMRECFGYGLLSET